MDQLLIHIPSELKNKLKILAAIKGDSIKNIVIKLIEKYIEEN